MTITLDEDVYEDLLRPHVLNTSLDDGYKAMALDTGREAEAAQWCSALSLSITNETR